MHGNGGAYGCEAVQHEASKNVMAKDAEERIEISGIVIPHDWDERGRVVVVAVSGPDEEEYVVQPTTRGRELLDLIHETVAVSGVIRKDKIGREVIIVKKYRVTSSTNKPVSELT